MLCVERRGAVWSLRNVSIYSSISFLISLILAAFSAFLMSGSLFADIEKEVQPQTADRAYLKQAADSLLDKLLTAFFAQPLLLNRARIAAVLKELPVFFNSQNDVMDYVRTRSPGSLEFRDVFLQNSLTLFHQCPAFLRQCIKSCLPTKPLLAQFPKKLPEFARALKAMEAVNLKQPQEEDYNKAQDVFTQTAKSLEEI